MTLQATYSCLLNLVGKLDEELLVFGGILASHKDFDWKSAPFQLFEMLG